ncbi:hypothetical protein SAMD00019534_016280 [Acytostelium subglobosum LB1]|uniref:hypothetical protein n=1 Tax=Acytostelium subglobosum LB1 TaxID=1410327 RepID=UPI00064494D6|nr:hypothetical protein SAMD00019534_016280 [Acytostelium subglobosum LB1]GAM18453.1 hypothetical protein SAMD00019534_016280 [Acytostelium subglobosum LB1]|eukprot:XP_012757673.1 hypothetical protein SAMD00019534_016280 [Acytostelium subglobosum LB1]
MSRKSRKDTTSSSSPMNNDEFMTGDMTSLKRALSVQDIYSIDGDQDHSGDDNHDHDHDHDHEHEQHQQHNDQDQARPRKRAKYQIVPKTYKCVCGATSPGKGPTCKWRKGTNGEVLCNSCGLQSMKKPKCPYCAKVYVKEEAEADNVDWLRCWTCDQWVMSKCDSVTDSFRFSPANPKAIAYSCPKCRKNQIKQSKLAQKQQRIVQQQQLHHNQKRPVPPQPQVQVQVQAPSTDTHIQTLPMSQSMFHHQQPLHQQDVVYLHHRKQISTASSQQHNQLQQLQQLQRQRYPSGLTICQEPERAASSSNTNAYFSISPSPTKFKISTPSIASTSTIQRYPTSRDVNHNNNINNSTSTSWTTNRFVGHSPPFHHQRTNDIVHVPRLNISSIKNQSSSSSSSSTASSPTSTSSMSSPLSSNLNNIVHCNGYGEVDVNSNVNQWKEITEYRAQLLRVQQQQQQQSSNNNNNNNNNDDDTTSLEEQQTIHTDVDINANTNNMN